MFFEKEALAFHILDVVELRQSNVHKVNRGRPFHALSFRFCSDAVLKVEAAEYRMKDACISFVPAGLDYTRTATHDELIAVHFDTADYRTHTIECFEAHPSSRLAELFRAIADCFDKKPLGYKHRCSALLCEIFAECYKQNYTEKSKNSKIQGAVEYLLKNYKSSSLTMKEIAEHSFMSEVYFRKLFKAEYGTSPQKYIMGLRIQNAVSLLSAGYHSLKEIAYLSGYNDYKYFSIEFKRAMGVSPSEYLGLYK